MRVLVFHYSSELNRGLSYQHGWRRAFAATPHFQSIFYNLAQKPPALDDLRALLFEKVDAIIVLHSAFSNACLLPLPLQYLIRMRGVPVVFFVGNEYKLMPEKMRFAKRIGVSLFVTQIFHQEAVALYKQRLGIPVLSIPGGGLDADLYPAGPAIAQRSIDVGFRAYPEPYYFGHQEREMITLAAQEACPRLGLKADVSMDPKDRLVEADWARFLHSCKTMIGTYSGFDHFDLMDETRNMVNAYTTQHPAATFPEIYQQFFANRPRGVVARMLSGRHIEAAGTKTAQILVEGEYSGFFQPDEHYIPLRGDLSNLDEALEKVRDASFCQKIADNAYEVAVKELTFDRHLDRLYGALAPLCR